MVFRGSKVGDAYIEVHGDNAPWIKAVNRNRKEWAKAGKNTGDAWAQALDNAVQGRVQQTWKRLANNLALEDFGDFERQFGSIEEGYRRATLAAQHLYSANRQNNVITKEQNDQLLANLAAWRDRRVEAERQLQIQKELHLERETAHRDAIAEERERQMLARRGAAMAKNLERDQIESLVRLSLAKNHYLRIDGERFDKANEAMVRSLRERGREIDDSLRLEAEMFEQHKDRILGIIQERAIQENRAYDRVYQQAERRYARALSIDIGDLTEVHRREIREWVDEHVRGFRTIEDRFRRMTQNVANDSEFYLVGRLRGSRNNFLNLLGRMFQPIERVTNRFASRMFGPVFDRLGDGIGRLGTQAATARSPLARLVSGPLSSLARLLPALGRLGPAALIGMALALNIFAIAASAAATLLSSLVAMATGVLSAALLGAAGILTSLLPMAAAFGLGVGAIVIAMTDLDDATKRALTPLKDWFETTRAGIQQNLFANAGTQAQTLANVLGEFLTPALEDAATETSNFLDRMSEMSQSPGFRRVLATLRDELPAIFGDLLRIGGAAFGGLGAIISAIAPQVKEITDGIATALEDWVVWASSAEGQNTIADWFRDARIAGKALWDLLTAVAGVVGTIVKLAAPQGLEWIDGWIDGLERFDAWLNSPEGQKAFDDWMTRAKEVATELGELVDSVGHLFDTLDSNQGGDWLIGLINGLTSAITLIDRLVGGVQNTWTSLTSYGWDDLWDDMFGFLTGDGPIPHENPLQGFFDSIRESVASAGDWLRNIGTQVVVWILEGFITARDNIREAAIWIVEGFRFGWDEKWSEIREWLLGKLAEFVSWFTGFFGIASPSTMFHQFGVDIVQGLINGILSMLASLANAVTELANTILGVVTERFPQIVATGIELLMPLVPGILTLLPGVSRSSTLVGKAIGAAITGEARKVPGATGRAMSPLPGVVGGQASAAANAGARGMSSMGPRMAYAAASAVVAVRNVLSGLSGIGYAAGVSVGAGFVNGMDAMIPSVYAKARGMASSAKAAASAELLSQSPSRVFIGLGMDVAAGFGIGMESGTARVMSAAATMASAVIDAVNPESMYSQGRLAAEGLAAGLAASTPSLNAAIEAPDIPGAGAGYRTAVFGPGSVIVDSRAKNAKIVAEQVVDDLANALEG